MENGGLINQVLPGSIHLLQVGTFTMAVMAQSFNIPFYAVAESYKFVRSFPLGSDDLPSCASAALIGPSLAPITTNQPTILAKRHSLGTVEAWEGMSVENAALVVPGHATIDYTPPAYITLLFTDLGLLTPSSVSDELIKLYY